MMYVSKHHSVRGMTKLWPQSIVNKYGIQDFNVGKPALLQHLHVHSVGDIKYKQQTALLCISFRAASLLYILYWLAFSRHRQCLTYPTMCILSHSKYGCFTIWYLYKCHKCLQTGMHRPTCKYTNMYKTNSKIVHISTHVADIYYLYMYRVRG